MKPYLIFAIVSAALAGLLFGVNTGNIAGALPFIQQQFETTTLLNELLVSCTILFAFLSALLSARVSEKYGYQRVLLFTGGCFLIGSLIIGVAESIEELIVARILLGVAIGISSYAAPSYISEIAPTNYRGAFVLLNGIAITGGEALAFIVDYFLSAEGQWRLMLSWSFFPALLFLITMFFMPSTPRWLMAQGRLTEAKNILTKFHPGQTSSHLIAQLYDIKSRGSISLGEILVSKKYRSPLIIAIMLGIFQQFFGINTIMYYGPFIFEKAGFSLDNTAIWVTFIMGFVNLLTTIFTGFLVDNLGRRIMLLTGSGLAGVSLVVIAFLFDRELVDETEAIGIIIAMITYIIGYCVSVGSLFWLIISEIFPAPMKYRGASLATSVQWFSNFIVSFTFLSMLENFGASRTFFFYSLICFSALVFIYRFVPETKKISLENISVFQES